MVYLAYTGAQAMFLTEDAQFTYFRTVYVRNTASEAQTFVGNFDQIGDTTWLTDIQQRGQYITGLSLKFQLPALVNPPTTVWNNSTPGLLGQKMQVFRTSDNTKLYELTINGSLPVTTSTTWYTATYDTLGGTLVSVSNNKFVFATGGNTCYAVFSSIELANFWGFVYLPQTLYGGYVRFDSVNSNQVTFQESGWLPGGVVYGPEYSYVDQTMYRLINRVGLYIGRQLIQEFDSAALKFYHETHEPYKNRPVLKLLEGNTDTVVTERTYYVELPFVDFLPIHALVRHDIQIVLDTNPVSDLPVGTTVFPVVTYEVFDPNIKLPAKYTIPVNQVAYFSNRTKLDIRGPLKALVFDSDSDTATGAFLLNGETFVQLDESIKFSAIESRSLKNIPQSSNVVIIGDGGTVNMSRIRDQKLTTPSNVYAQTINFLEISDDLAGLAFDTTETRGQFPVYTGNIVNTASPPTVYLFDQISDSVGNQLAMYSLRVVSSVYSGPVVRLRRDVDDAEDDFYSDSRATSITNSTGTSVTDWSSNSTNVYVTVWYDQSIYKNNAIQPSKTSQPIFIVGPTGSMSVGAGPAVSFPNDVDTPGTYWMSFTQPIRAQQIVLRQKVTGTSLISTLFGIGHDAFDFYGPSRNFIGDFADWIAPLSNSTWSSRWGSGIINWKNDDQAGDNSTNQTNNLFPLNQWNTFVTWAQNHPAYTGGGGGFSYLGYSPIFTNRPYTGQIFEFGFFTGTTMLSDAAKYSNSFVPPVPPQPGPPQSGSATSTGTVTTYSNYVVHTFTATGSFTVLSTSLTVDVLIVAGGGGGGGTDDRTAGGGGGGGVLYLTNQTLSSGTYMVTVGSGGVGGATGLNGSNGGNSVFGTIGTAIGGGGGAGANFVNGNSGGSGGGICHGAGTAGAGTSGQGFGGGPSSFNQGFIPGVFTASGGGGAGGTGGNGTSSGGGAGGVGVQNSITGTSTYYAGGGGGSANYILVSPISGGAGGLGGGGSGATTSGPNLSGTSVNGNDATYYGGGGGGSAANSGGPYGTKGGDGYQGIVIVRYIG